MYICFVLVTCPSMNFVMPSTLVLVLLVWLQGLHHKFGTRHLDALRWIDMAAWGVYVRKCYIVIGDWPAT